MGGMAPSLNKLSIELLADAFTREEVQGGRVFAVFGCEKTLTTLRLFLKALKRNDGTLFGMPLVCSEIVPASEIILGAVCGGRWPQAHDFTTALESGLALEERSDGVIPTVWGRRLRLV